jgi:1-deoxy-D-xylulose-5-phosphate reductoisomerase
MGFMKKIALLGSTGSIGQNTLRVAKHLGYPVVALAAHSNIILLEEQIKEFQPKLVALYSEEKGRELKKKFPKLEILFGKEGVDAVATFSEANFVVSAISGTLGLRPTVAAIQAGKDIGLANKEALVSGGELVMGLAKQKRVKIIPIDSEHSAIFQCLQGGAAPKRLIITASGGPFRNLSREALLQVKPQDALKHPTWSMGQKITIDSSTLMNKGLEVIEAHFLFSLPAEQIEVVVHPQSIIHSMVEFADGSILAQMGEPTMILPIQYALTYPQREEGFLPPFDFTKARNLEFFPPDYGRFECLKLAFEALKLGASYPCFMNGANEVLVNRFLKGEISWLAIGEKLKALMDCHRPSKPKSFEEIDEIDFQAKQEASQF